MVVFDSEVEPSGVDIDDVDGKQPAAIDPAPVEPGQRDPMGSVGISAVVPTRNRGDRAAVAIASLLANDHPEFEVILVDQSPDDSTERAVEQYFDDPRFRYHRSDAQGAGRARTTGLRLATHDLVAFTDDDCSVPTDWLSVIAEVMTNEPRAGLLFCRVEAADHDDSKGFVPTHLPTSEFFARSALDKNKVRGAIGAGMAMRRSIAVELGGFDLSMGPGSHFRSGEDADIAVRFLLNGWWIAVTARTAVVHDGFRSWHEGAQLGRRDWYSLGAVYAKPIKAGHWSYWGATLFEGIYVPLIRRLLLMFRLQRPRGLRDTIYFWQGFVAGLRTPLDRDTLLYLMSPEDEMSAEDDV